ncbi:peptidase [Amaricoccus macauensis]|uniref:peptidase n=1 Tax=Amaricoccus macauensis TaxID=57001 RepID=UPI003C7C2B5A
METSMMDQVWGEPDTDESARVIRHAREWIGTPYRHQSSCKGAGADCLGLIRGVWRELIGPEPQLVPPYTPDWSETDGTEDFLQAAHRHLIPVCTTEACPGDIAILRMRDGGVAKHAGFLARSEHGYRTLIHAYSGHGVVESPLTPAWSRKIAAVFRFPDRRN